MKSLTLVTVFVAITIAWTLFDNDPPTMGALTVFEHQSPSYLAPLSTNGDTPPPLPAANQPTIEVETGDEHSDDANENERQRISIGARMDPDDPETWAASVYERISIGEPMDPEDPQTWSKITEAPISIGPRMDPEDPLTWETNTSEPISIGPLMDPEDPYTWLTSGRTQPISIGKRMDPEDPNTW